MSNIELIKDLTIREANGGLVVLATNIDTDADITRWGVMYERLLS